MDIVQPHQADSLNLLDAAPIGVMALDLAFNVIRINKVGADLLAKSQAAIEGTDIRTLVAPMDLDGLHRHLQLVVRRTATLSTKVRLLKNNGELLYTQWWSRTDNHASLLNEKYIVVSFADITAQALYKPLLRRKNAFQRTLIEQSPFAIFSTDIHGVINTINPAAERMFGYSAKELIGSATPLVFMLKDELLNLQEPTRDGLLFDDPLSVLMDYCAMNGHGAKEWTYVRKNGVRGTMLLSVAPIKASGKPSEGVIFEAIDVTHQKQQEQTITRLNRSLKSRVRELYQAQKRSEATLMAIADGVVITDKHGRIEAVNAAAAQFFAFSEEELKGRYLNELLRFESADSEPILECLEKCVSTKAALRSTSSRVIVNRNGQHRYIEETIAPITTHYGKVCGAVLVFRDVTHNVRLVKKVIHQAHHDELTGLYNRRYFNQALKKELEDLDAGQPRSTSTIGGALLILDLDHFKAVNDSCGHLAGDELLRHIATILQQCCGDHGMVARIGGDEFAVYLRNCSPQTAYEMALSIIDRLKAFRFEWESHTYRIGVSIGVAMIDGSNHDPIELQSRADTSAYIAKRSGRNRVHVYGQSDQHMCDGVQTDWFNRINRAMDENQFELYTQSIQSLAQQNRINFEFLIRLNNPDHAMVMPAEFIPAAERYNLMTAIDRWVTTNAFQWLFNHSEQTDRLERCSINISATSLSEDGFCQFIEDELLKWNIPCSKICFELTETARIGDVATTAHAMLRLKTLGCEFSLDDFGAGYTSYELLKALPVDYIKIDGKLVQKSAASHVDYIMVKSICDISKAMGKKTIAEYVDSEQVLNSMREIGVDYVQGFYIDQPKNLSERRVSQVD